MDKTKKHTGIEVIIHLLAWCLLFGLPFVFMLENRRVSPDQFLGYMAYMIAFLIIFYANYLYLITQLLFDRKTIKFFAVNIVLILACTWLLHLYHLLEFQDVKHGPPPPPQAMFIFRDITSMVFAAGLSVAIRMTGKWYKTETDRKEMERSRYESELKNLKNQLNPHFLFNTLNNIYSLIPVNPEQAQETVHRLSMLLRYVLYENNDNFVPLSKEVSFLRSYIELMSLRLSDQVELTTTINMDDSQDNIAPMVFISLVENAFKHGISPIHNSFIHINITAEKGKCVVCTVTNSYFPKTDKDKSGSGIGQENLKKRLQLLYPNKHELTLDARDNSYFAQLKITF
jgi:two-component sensor histidine kinase